MQGRINRQCMTLQVLTSVLAILIATVSHAQSAGEKAAESYVAEVIAAGDIYAGGGRKYYTVGRVEAGQRVVVRGELFQWYNIVPPAGVYSYMTKGYVDATGDGRRGVVNRAHSDFTAASLDGPGVSYVRQSFLDKGAIVTIVAEEGSYYKIEPPAGTIVWLPPNSLRKLEGVSVDAVLNPAAQGGNQEATSTTVKPEPKPVETTPVTPEVTEAAEPVMEEVTVPSVAEETTPESATTAESDTAITTTDDAAPTVESTTPAVRSIYELNVKAESPAVQALEAKLLEAGRKPLQDQPLESLIADYTQASKQADLPALDQRLIGARIEQLTRQSEVAALLKSLKQTQDTIGDSKVAVEEAPQPRPRTAYTAVGQLLASGVYDGQSAPLLYRVVEPANLRTIAYVRPGKTFDTNSSLGKLVGVIGSSTYDPALRLRVLDVEELDILDN